MPQTTTISNSMFSPPTIRYQNNGLGGWCKENSLSQWQKGTGWTINLYGGTQTGDDWAAAFFACRDMPVPDFNTARWSYYMTGTETMGVNLVIWVHDKNDPKKRAEITQVGGNADLGKAAGWNSHVFNKDTTQMFFYGENTTGTALAAGTQYPWTSFQTDKLFMHWTIYRISLEYGWEASGTFDDVWLAEAEFQNEKVTLIPPPGTLAGGETKTLYVATASDSSTRAAAITPATAKKVRIIAVDMVTTSNTAVNFEVYFHTGANITTTPANAIAIAALDADGYRVCEHFFFGDHGPVGGIGEVVSIRTSANITTNGLFVFTYREE